MRNLHQGQFGHLRDWTPGLGEDHRLYTLPRTLFGSGSIANMPTMSAFHNANRRLLVPDVHGGTFKPYVPVDHAAVTDAVRGLIRGDTHPEDIDPRTLLGSQHGVTKSGLDFYMDPDNEYARTGRTFADQNQAGNRVPVVYENADLGVRVLRTGHHRATAALLKGEPLRALVVQGGSGEHPQVAHEWMKGWGA